MKTFHNFLININDVKAEKQNEAKEEEEKKKTKILLLIFGENILRSVVPDSNEK